MSCAPIHLNKNETILLECSIFVSEIHNNRMQGYECLVPVGTLDLLDCLTKVVLVEVHLDKSMTSWGFRLSSSEYWASTRWACWRMFDKSFFIKSLNSSFIYFSTHYLHLLSSIVESDVLPLIVLDFFCGRRSGFVDRVIDEWY